MRGGLAGEKVQFLCLGLTLTPAKPAKGHESDTHVPELMRFIMF